MKNLASMQYKINFSERKTTSTGKQKIDAELVDMAGEVHKGVTIWADFPGWNNLMTGGTVEGDVVSKQNGKYTNKTLYPARSQTSYTPRGGTQRAGSIKDAVEAKNVNIKENMETKNESIKMAGAQRDAVLIVTTFYKNRTLTDAETEERIERWYNYFMNKLNGAVEPF